MSGLSRMGQNCFGVGTPILSPLPPAGSTAATAGAQHRISVSVPTGPIKEAEAAWSAPHRSCRRGRSSAGPEPPGGPGSMAAGSVEGLSRSGPKRPAAAWAPGRARGGGGLMRAEEYSAQTASPERSGPGPCGSPGNYTASDLSSARACGLCAEPSAPGRAVSLLFALAGPAGAAGGSVSLPHITKGPFNLRSCEWAVEIRTPSYPSPLERI